MVILVTFGATQPLLSVMWCITGALLLTRLDAAESQKDGAWQVVVLGRPGCVGDRHVERQARISVTRYGDEVPRYVDGKQWLLTEQLMDKCGAFMDAQKVV